MESENSCQRKCVVSRSSEKLNPFHFSPCLSRAPPAPTFQYALPVSRTHPLQLLHWSLLLDCRCCCGCRQGSDPLSVTLKPLTAPNCSAAHRVLAAHSLPPPMCPRICASPPPPLLPPIRWPALAWCWSEKPGPCHPEAVVTHSQRPAPLYIFYSKVTT